MGVLRLRSDAFSENKAVKPTAVAGAAAGTSPTGLTNAGRDDFGSVSITTGTSTAAGTLFTLTFNNAYTVAPDAVIVDDNGGVASYGSATTTALTISAKTAPAASTAIKVNYVLVGGV